MLDYNGKSCLQQQNLFGEMLGEVEKKSHFIGGFFGKTSFLFPTAVSGGGVIRGCNILLVMYVFCFVRN